MSPRKRRVTEKLRSLYLWHRYAGLVAALLAAWLAVTGIFLNHTEDLGLVRRNVGQAWLHDLYNLEAPRNLQGQRVAGHWLTIASGRIYLDEQFIGTGNSAMGAPTGFGFVVAFDRRLRLFTPEGELIEEVLFAEAASPITAIESTADGIIVATDDGHFHADPEVTAFEPIEPVELRPLKREPLPEPLQRSIGRDVLSQALNWERILLDLHSGRLFGRAGIWLADLAGVLLLLLAVTGVVVWLQRAAARRRHH